MTGGDCCCELGSSASHVPPPPGPPAWSGPRSHPSSLPVRPSSLGTLRASRAFFPLPGGGVALWGSWVRPGFQPVHRSPGGGGGVAQTLPGAAGCVPVYMFMGGLWEERGVDCWPGASSCDLSPQGAPIPDHTLEPEPSTHYSRGERSMCSCVSFSASLISVRSGHGRGRIILA